MIWPPQSVEKVYLGIVKSPLTWDKSEGGHAPPEDTLDKTYGFVRPWGRRGPQAIIIAWGAPRGELDSPSKGCRVCRQP